MRRVQGVGGTAVPHLGHRGPQAATPARMGQEGLASPTCQRLHLAFRPLSRGLGPSCLCIHRVPSALDLSGFEHFGWHYVSPGLF